MIDSCIYGTRLYLDPTNAQGMDYDCTDAWLVISDTMDSLNSPIVLDVLNKTLGINTTMGDNAITKTSDALQAVGAASTFAIDYMKTAILKPFTIRWWLGSSRIFTISAHR